ncbi:hypothetical protein [Actinotalea subterranea]|uniref:hypothetical protein n=1 Tax=Actinotalea subterranea TaxID=2607497 RepID=UPI0011F034CB|nr:hypothetical protein [Actinotalea subterranea]
MTTDTRIDATRQATGCGSISLHALTLELSGDLTIIADGVASTNGMHVVSADGLPHTLRILVPGQINDGTSGHAISMLGGTTADETITVEIGTPGVVNLSGGVAMGGQVAAGHINADGQVTVGATADSGRHYSGRGSSVASEQRAVIRPRGIAGWWSRWWALVLAVVLGLPMVLGSGLWGWLLLHPFGGDPSGSAAAHGGSCRPLWWERRSLARRARPGVLASGSVSWRLCCGSPWECSSWGRSRAPR